ncbi:hypothetical protein SUGI_0666710 [Cryptomeria japonica]|nr:hypothetical protein SUGI_0666710 [Cryptomeria japonica]
MCFPLPTPQIIPPRDALFIMNNNSLAESEIVANNLNRASLIPIEGNRHQRFLSSNDTERILRIPGPPMSGFGCHPVE